MGGHAVFVPAYALPAIRSRAHPLRACGRSLVMPAMPCPAGPGQALPRHAAPSHACLAVPCRAAPCLALPGHAMPAEPSRAAPCRALPCRAMPAVMPVTLSGHGKKPMRRSALSPCVHVWCVPSSPIAVICCGTGASAWVWQVGTRCALTGRFTVLLGVDVPANHGAQQAVGQRLSALPRDCSPIARHIAQPIDIHKEAHNVAQRMRVLSFDSLRSALPCAAYVSKRPRAGTFCPRPSTRCDESSRFAALGAAFLCAR